MKISVTDRSGNRQQVQGTDGDSLMAAIRDLDDSVEAICGGVCACATCHVYVADGWFGKLPAIKDDEDDLLDALEHRRANSRLSCQIELHDSLDGIAVTIGPEE